MNAQHGMVMVIDYMLGIGLEDPTEVYERCITWTRRDWTSVTGTKDVALHEHTLLLLQARAGRHA